MGMTVEPVSAPPVAVAVAVALPVSATPVASTSEGLSTYSGIQVSIVKSLMMRQSMLLQQKKSGQRPQQRRQRG